MGWYTLGNYVNIFVPQLMKTDFITKFIIEQFGPKFNFQISIGEGKRKHTEHKAGKNRKMMNSLERYDNISKYNSNPNKSRKIKFGVPG